MTANSPSFKDLDNLENKIKLDITSEQQKIRHNQNNELQNYFYMVDDLKTDSALAKQSFKMISTNIEKLEKVITEWFKEVQDEFKSMHLLYTTKEEHEVIKKEVTDIKATHNKVISWLVGTVATIFIAFLILLFNFHDKI